MVYYRGRDSQVTRKPIVVYPNSGETYIAETNEWVMRFFHTVACLCHQLIVSYLCLFLR